MPEWIESLLDNRMVRNWTLGALGFTMLASSGGMLLANYTVAGMNPLYRGHAAEQLAARDVQPGLVREIATRLPDSQAGWRDDLTDPDTARFEDASY